MTAPSKPLTAVIYDEFDITRAGLRMTVNAAADLDVVDDTDSLDRIGGLVDQWDPDVLFMSVKDIDALKPLVRISTRHGGPAVVILVANLNVDELTQALRLGVRGIVCHSDAGWLVVEAARAVARGEAFLSPTATTCLIDRFTESLPDAQAMARIRLAGLTSREHEVLHLVADGQSTVEMARTLGVTGATVKSHLSRLLAKLGTRERVQAAVLAHRAGLAHLPATHKGTACYRNAGQCSGLQPGDEGPRWEGRQARTVS